MNKAIFLDRDGTLNYDYSYVYRLEDLRILNGVKEGLESLKFLGYLLILITNQSGIGRGYYSIDDCNKFNNELQKQLGIKFDGIYICPHSPDDKCECRKPNTKFVEDAINDFNLNIEDCFFVGDKDSDIQTGINAGCKTVLVKNDIYENKIVADIEINSLIELGNILEKY